MEREVVSNKKVELCNLKIRREASGVVVYVKSKILEEYFKDYSKGQLSEGGQAPWNEGKKGYKVKNFPIQRVGTGPIPVVTNWENHELFNWTTPMINLSFLRTVGLSEGVEFKFEGLFMTADIEKFKEQFKLFVVKFYQEYLKVCEFEVTVTSGD